jgi:HD-like signal output (HDOD) protein
VEQALREISNCREELPAADSHLRFVTDELRLGCEMDKKKEISRKITEIIGDLPLFPRDVDRLLTTAVKPAGDNTEILRLIESDPKLSGKLLQLVRSYFGTTDRIETIDDAVCCVGVEPLVQLIGISYAREAIQQEFRALTYLNEYIDHSEDIAIACSVLTELGPLAKEERQVYTLAGLIHDVGRLAIIVASNRTSAHVLGTLWDKMVSVVHDEKASLGTNHCDVGVRICRKWNFSPLIQEAVQRHHTPLVNGDFSYPGALVFIAHFLSASDPSGDILSSLSASDILNRLKLSETDFDKARKLYKSRTR